MENYKFYLQKINADGTLGTKKDIETDFEGCRYKSLEGIEIYGKQKVYTESYPETSELDVYIPTTPVLENPTLKLTLLFFGENRRATYHNFVDFILGSKLYYWDTCRKRKVLVYVSEAIEPTTDLVYKGSEYIECPFVFMNLKGNAEDIKD